MKLTKTLRKIFALLLILFTAFGVSVLVSAECLIDVHYTVAVEGLTNAVRAAVILFYTANEAISILENAARLGLPVPEKLKNTLEKAKDSAGKGEGD